MYGSLLFLLENFISLYRMSSWRRRKKCNKYNHHYHYQHQQHQQVILFVTFQLFSPAKQFKLIKKGTTKKNIHLYLKHIWNNEPLNVNNEMRRKKKRLKEFCPMHLLLYTVPTIKYNKKMSYKVNRVESAQHNSIKQL